MNGKLQHAKRRKERKEGTNKASNNIRCFDSTILAVYGNK